MVHGYVTIDAVIAKLYRDLGINTEVNEAHVVEWIAEALDKIGSFAQYEEIKDCLKLEKGKVKLPTNFYRIKDIGYNGQPLAWASPSMLTAYGCEGSGIPVCCTNYSFYIEGCYIITDIDVSQSESTQNLNLIYLGVPADENGYPLIPDDVYFMEATAKYVTYMLDYREWRKGNLADKVINKSEQDWLFYVNSARGSANMPTERQMSNLKNIWTKMIPDMNGDTNFFKQNAIRERRIRY
jgi:hypothetical protein